MYSLSIHSLSFPPFVGDDKRNQLFYVSSSYNITYENQYVNLERKHLCQ